MDESPSQVITASWEDAERYERENFGAAEAASARRHAMNARSIAKQRQERMFARAAAGITKHPKVAKVVEPSRRPRERRSAPAQRRSSSSSRTSSSDPGDPEPPAAAWRWASPESWRQFVKDVLSRRFENEIARERAQSGWSR
jgi:hypothetical protein